MYFGSVVISVQRLVDVAVYGQYHQESKEPHLMYGVLEEMVVDSVLGTDVTTTSVLVEDTILPKLSVYRKGGLIRSVQEEDIPVAHMNVQDVEDVPLMLMDVI